MPAITTRIRRLLRRLRADCRGNILMTMGLAIIPMTFAIGFGVDYSRAERLQTRLNAAADAATLAAVVPSMIFQSDATAQSAAQAMFDSQTSGLPGLTNLQRSVTITDISNASLGTLRKVTLTYSALSVNMFSGILHVGTLPIGGSATANAQQPPNVNFYLAMDVSPSMLLPATAAGLTNEASATAAHANSPNGCDFACHEMIPHSDNIYINDTTGRQVLLSTGYYGNGSTANTWYRYNNTGTATLYDSNGNSMNSSTVSTTGGVTTTTTYTYQITDSTTAPVIISLKTKVANVPGLTTTTITPYDTGYWADGYWLTHNYGLIYGSPASLTLRRDDQIAAAQQLIPFAANQASYYHVTYKMQMFSFDWTHPGSTTGPLNQLTSMTDVGTMGGIDVASLLPATDYWWKNSQPTIATNINDQGSEMGNMLSQMTSVMPVPGNGSSSSTPQEILFLITDGMADQSQGGRRIGPLSSADLAQCAAIKAKGIKIAILYTQYLSQALVGDSWSQSNVAPYLPAPPFPYAAGSSGSSDQIFAALQTCSSPGASGVPLVQTVTTDGDFTAALQQLFSTALQSARLVQ